MFLFPSVLSYPVFPFPSEINKWKSTLRISWMCSSKLRLICWWSRTWEQYLTVFYAVVVTNICIKYCSKSFPFSSYFNLSSMWLIFYFPWSGKLCSLDIDVKSNFSRNNPSLQAWILLPDISCGCVFFFFITFSLTVYTKSTLIHRGCPAEIFRILSAPSEVWSLSIKTKSFIYFLWQIFAFYVVELLVLSYLSFLSGIRFLFNDVLILLLLCFLFLFWLKEIF